MKIIKYLSIFLKSITHKKTFYSYGGIDSLINNIFKNNDKGFYVDVGCGHPIKNNNTYLLNKKGWYGVNIDLDNDNIDLFDVYRPTDLNISTAISDKKGEEDLFFYHSKSSINTIDKKTADYQKAKVSNIKKIRTNTLNNVLNNSKYSSLEIDFLSIDIEGSEYRVLDEILKNKEKAQQTKYIALREQDIFDLDTGMSNKEYIPIDGNEVENYINNVLAKIKYPYEKDSMPNIEKLIKDVQKASDEYEDFVSNYEQRKATKKDSLYKLGNQLQKKLSKWQSIRRWEKSPSFITHNTERNELPVDMDDAIKYIAIVCEEETIKAYDRSKKGQAIRNLDAQKEEAENALYSGGSMVDVRQYIHNIFNTAGIADRVAKSLLMLSK